MNRSLLLITALLVGLSAAFAMSGAPVFCIGEKMTGMTVEGTQTAMKLNGEDGESDSFTSQRLMLTAHYGLMPNMDCAIQLGASNLSFGELSSGYSEFSADWAFAWGGGVRFGYPDVATPFQVLAAVNYFGFQPQGQTSNGTKNISTNYLWHEVTPVLTAGYAVGAVVPYVGISKPYLFGNKDVNVSFNGQEFPAAGGKTNYSDGEQAIRGLFGLEWRWPDGYSLSAEAAASGDRLWTVSIGIAQLLK